MLVKLHAFTHPQRIPFKFKNVWVDDEGYKGLLEETWGTRVYGCPMYCCTRKLNTLKLALKKLNLGKFSNLQTRVKQAREALAIT